ncbi:hypothetical protein ACFL0I_00200 [Gemmatimonadota bacterium]
MRPDLYRMFYPLPAEEQDRWAEILNLPFADYAARGEEEAGKYGCTQETSGDVLVWVGKTGSLELMLFRVPDPGNLGVVRSIYGTLEETGCPMAYAFVNQRGDAQDAWDVFQLSRLSYLCHCNRVSGPGSTCRD